MMTSSEAALLGLVQGLFMFVPVSSTSHLALTQHWLIGRGASLLAPESPEMILFDLVERRWAAEYSFILAIPTIAGATLLQAIDVARAPDVTVGAVRGVV